MHQADGSVYEEGPYVDGKRRGHWIRRHANGTVYREGPYVDGEKHGQWVTHYTDESVYEATFVEGSGRGSGLNARRGVEGLDRRHNDWREGGIA